MASKIKARTAFNFLRISISLWKTMYCLLIEIQPLATQIGLLSVIIIALQIAL